MNDKKNMGILKKSEANSFLLDFFGFWFGLGEGE